MLTNHFKLTPDNPPNEGILFVDHQKHNRSGHLGHAMVEYAPGKILAFFPNCSSVDTRWNGHSGHGWMEFKRSLDGGDTWSEPMIEPNSKALFDDSGETRSFMCEKAVVTDTGRIVLFYLKCDIETEGHIWEPFMEPHFAISDDGGETFSKTKPLTDQAARIYDARYHDGVIYVMAQNGTFCGNFFGECDDHSMHLYVSTDNGETFTHRSEINFDRSDHSFYGTMIFQPDGRLFAYAYDEYDEYNLKYNVSDDCGMTWGLPRRAFFEKRIRNPQIAYFGGMYLIHGRSGSWGEEDPKGHFIAYTSPDGIHWDEGQYLRMREAHAGSYSNNLIVHHPDGRERLLIQTSHAYELAKTNLLLYWVDKK